MVQEKNPDPFSFGFAVTFPLAHRTMAPIVWYTPYMQFELTEALLDDILFAMEDQQGEFYMDTVEGVVCGGIDGLDFLEEEDNNGKDGERYISLPDWDSSDGFRLMERFAAGFRNPLIREELSSALSRGRGVFRAFKDTLSRFQEVEKLWFSFKEREMKREIIVWYNGLREEWGLEKIGLEPEETADLVLEDFRFRPFKKEDMLSIGELHQRCLEEHKETLAETGTGSSTGVLLTMSQEFHNLFNAPEAGKSAASSSSDAHNGFQNCLVAESGGGDFAGYISGIAVHSTLYIKNLEVKAEYRGLGIGEALLTHFLESLDPNEINEALLDLPSWVEGFSRVLHRESFKPYTVRYWLKLRDRSD